MLGNRAVIQFLRDEPVVLQSRFRDSRTSSRSNIKPFSNLLPERAAPRPLINESLAFGRQEDGIGLATKSSDRTLHRQSVPTTPETSSEIESTSGAGARQSHITTAAAWLVSSPVEWKTSRVATLDTGDAIDVIDVGGDASFNRCDEEYRWWKVSVLSGRAKGLVGWVMRRFLTENRTQPEDTQILVAVRRLVAQGKHSTAIDLVILEYGIDKRGAEFEYAPRLATPGSTDGFVIPIVVRIGPTAFTSLAKLTRVIIHELEHVRQFNEGMESGGHEYDLGQFLSECAEMTTVGVAEYTFSQFMQSADMASRYWNALGQTPAGRDQQEDYWDTFVATRKVIHSRYDEADPESRRKKHERLLGWYDTQKNPAPPPLP